MATFDISSIASHQTLSNNTTYLFFSIVHNEVAQQHENQIWRNRHKDIVGCKHISNDAAKKIKTCFFGGLFQLAPKIYCKPYWYHHVFYKRKRNSFGDMYGNMLFNSLDISESNRAKYSNWVVLEVLTLNFTTRNFHDWTKTN